jgi:RsiW-degrading membrane proteinase PrsW (M82 family)
MFETNLHAVEFAPLLFAAAVLLFTAIGWFFGHHQLKKRNKGVIVREPLVSAIFALTALVLGFTFSGSASRNSAQMDLMRTQAQALYKVYGSLKYLAPNDQLEIKKSLDHLLDIRLTAFQNIKSMSEIDLQAAKILADTRLIQEQVLLAAESAPIKNKGLISELLLPEVKGLTSAFSAGIINTKSHPSTLLLRFLFGLLCVAAFLIGYTMAVKKENDWLMAMFYTVIIGFTLYVILSLEFPNLLMPYQEINRDLLLLKDSVK